MSLGTGVSQQSLQNFAWASLEVLTQCFHSLIDLLEQCRQQGLEQQVQGLEQPAEVLEHEQDLEQQAEVFPNVVKFEDDIQVPPVGRPEFVRKRFGVPPRLLPPVMRHDRAQRYYAVAIGRQPGIYLSWQEAAEQVLGYGGNVHKVFITREEAESFLLQNHERK